MMKSFIILAIGLATIFMATGRADKAISHHEADSYEIINAHLTDKVPNDELEANLRAANDLLNSTGQDDKHLGQALTKFIMLANLRGKNYCDGQTNKIYKQLVEATGGKARYESHPKRRIDRLIRQYTIEHAKICQDVYPGQFDQKVKQLNSKTLNYVNAFTGPLISALVKMYLRVGFQSNGISDGANDFAPKEGQQASQHPVLNALLSFNPKALWEFPYEIYPATAYVAIKTMNGKVDANSRIESLFEKYITQPCEKYVNAVGPDVVEPAEFDFAFSPKVDETHQSVLYRGMLRHDLCKSLSTESEKLLTELTSLIKGDGDAAATQMALDSMESIVKFIDRK